MSEDNQPQSVWTPANIVTLVRILLIPVFVIAILSPWPQWLPSWESADTWKPWVAAFVFIALAATDSIDGYLARSRNEITDFGKFMDPLADKILVTAALLALIELHVLPSWVALVILIREFIVSGIRMVAASQGVVIAASWYGKAKTVFQMIAIVLFIIKDSHVLTSFNAVLHDWLYLLSWGVMVIALILTILSLVDYFLKAKDLLGFKGRESKRTASLKAREAQAPVMVDTSHLVELAQSVIDSASKAGTTVATAESCTGGMISASLTAIPGSSACMLGSIVSYANEVKVNQLGVDPETIETQGAVSQDTALQMAAGAREQLGSDIALSVTGIAGPGGAVPGKPVGTVWIGLASSEGCVAFENYFEGDRDQVRRLATKRSLELLKDACS